MIAFRLATGQYRCTCQAGRHDTRAGAAARREWGCDERTSRPVFADPLTGQWESKRWDLHRCPASQVGDEWGYAVSVWSAYGGQDDRGPLPVAGGWMDQTLWFAEADAILRSERSRYLVKREEERQRQRDQKQPRRGR